MSSRRRMGLMLAAVTVLAVIGCAGTGPKLFPSSPMVSDPLPDGSFDRWYDTDGDGWSDYCERLSPAGRIVRLSYSAGRHRPAEHIELDQIPVEQQLHLVLLLDSISYSVALEAWQGGRFRYCARPSRTIGPFPVMSDLSFSELFGCSPSPGVESCYFDGKHLTNGYGTYASDSNVNWAKYVDYRLDAVAHVPTYFDPYPWLSHELREIQEVVREHPAPIMVGYCVGTSAAGARHGRRGHQRALVEIDRSCQWMLWKTRGKVRFTLLSDHGHAYLRSTRVSVADGLAALGYKVSDHLDDSRSVVVPEFGMVGCAAIHTRTPEKVAKDVLGIAGVELSMYRDQAGDVIVQSRSGRATISHNSAGYRYRPEYGDPLDLKPTFDRLATEGRVDAAGFVDDRLLFDATHGAAFPDAVQRLWTAFHGLIQHTPDVMVSIEEGYYAGSPMMSSMVRMLGVHGNLKLAGASAFAMTSAGDLPPVLRIRDLRAALARLGVSLPGAIPVSQPALPSGEPPAPAAASSHAP